MEPFKKLESTFVVLPTQNIDTDQIIPARFLKVTDKKGLGENLFADWRYTKDGQPNADFPLNRPAAKGARILVAGDNFGCGSSREHAPWALVDFGFRVVISTSIADIFRNNALKNGLLPVVIEPSIHQKILTSPTARLIVDLEAQEVTLADGSKAQFSIDRFARYCLLNGVDELGFVLGHQDAISRFEQVGSCVA